jgi:hypothetical protein
MMVANIFGVNPAAMARGLKEALIQNFGDMKGAYRYVVHNEMPVLGPKAELIAPYVQDIGMRMKSLYEPGAFHNPSRFQFLAVLLVSSIQLTQPAQ